MQDKIIPAPIIDVCRWTMVEHHRGELTVHMWRAGVVIAATIEPGWT